MEGKISQATYTFLKKDSYFGNNFRLFILAYYYALKITYTVQNINQLKNIMR